MAMTEPIKTIHNVSNVAYTVQGEIILKNPQTRKLIGWSVILVH
jgi:hypothetical protein